MPGAPPTTATSPKLPLCARMQPPVALRRAAQPGRGGPGITPRRSSQTVPAWSRPWPVWQPGFRLSRASVCVARTARAHRHAGVGVQARGQIHRQHTEAGWRLSARMAAAMAPDGRAIRAQAQQRVDVQIGMRAPDRSHVVMATPAACAAQGLRGIRWQAGGVAQETHSTLRPPGAAAARPPVHRHRCCRGRPRHGRALRMGRHACASRATANPARAISVCGGAGPARLLCRREACASCSGQRRAAVTRSTARRVESAGA
jgi:hypothetical protein